MERSPLLPLPEGISIEQIKATETTLTITVVSTQPRSCCPLCQEPSEHVHSHSTRTVADVPCGGRSVVLRLCVRKKDGSFVAFFRSLLP